MATALSAALSYCILFANSALASIVTFPQAVWGTTPVHYYQVEDGSIIANPLDAGDQFSMQFDSMAALLRWKGGGEPPVIVADRPHAIHTGFKSILSPRNVSERELVAEIGHFNIQRAISFPDWGGMGSVLHFVMPWGMAWMEPLEGASQTPLSITAVSGPMIFGADPVEAKSDSNRAEVTELLTPNAIAERMDLDDKPEPTILIILGVLAAFFVIALFRLGIQLQNK